MFVCLYCCIVGVLPVFDVIYFLVDKAVFQFGPDGSVQLGVNHLVRRIICPYFFISLCLGKRGGSLGVFRHGFL